MRKTLIAAALAAALAPFVPAFADGFNDSAAVLSATPIVDRVPVNREECWSEQQRSYEERRVTRQDNGQLIGPGTVIGAIAGGVIGHQFGNSSGGRDRGTAAGAVIGGLVGNQVDRDRAGPSSGEIVEVERRPVTREVERCRTVQDVREVNAGFDVRYRYAGREFVTRMPYDPGRRIRLAVDVRPMVEGPAAYSPPPAYSAPSAQPGPSAPGYSRY
jgi:uncharacterized protein YcfJ